MLNDTLLRLWAGLQNSSLARRDGAEVVQVMMIMGLVAIIIVAIFAVLNPSIQNLGTDIIGKIDSIR